MKSIAFNLGCDFSDEHTLAIRKLVECTSLENSRYIGSVYGSPGGIVNPFGSTRPLKRETQISKKTFETNVKMLTGLGLKINFAFNSLFPHKRVITNKGYNKNVFDSDETLRIFEGVIDYLKGLGINTFILAHPMLVDYFHNHSIGNNTQIILSTIMNVHSLSQLLWIRKNWPRVIRICPALWLNRKLEWLAAANEIIALEPLVNEFCSIGGVECEGLYRQACYMSQTMDITWNPMLSRCIKSRVQEPWSWLMAKFILPQWISYYFNSTGISNYKITGRTHNVRFVKYIGESYLNGTVKGNLLSLWGHLEATLNKANWAKEQLLATSKTIIDIDDVVPLLEQFRTCDENRCRIDCTFCERFLKGLDNAKKEHKSQ